MLGATKTGLAIPAAAGLFQSSPSLGAGSNVPDVLVQDSLPPVSILSQLRCWEQQRGVIPAHKKGWVSILSQLRCWEQPQLAILLRNCILFQSSPSLGAGSNQSPLQPGFRLLVSILSQLRCWEQQVPAYLDVIVDWFQSSPSLGAGSNPKSS